MRNTALIKWRYADRSQNHPYHCFHHNGASLLSRIQANILLLSITTIWGGGFVAQALAMEHLGPFTFVGVRFLVGALVVLPFALRDFRLSQVSETLHGRKDYLLIAFLGFLLLAGAACQQIGILTTTVTNAGFLTTLYVPLVPILACVILRQAPHWLVWPASLGCMFGTWLLTGAESVSINVGDLWVIAGSLFWALHVLFVGKVATRIGRSFLVATGQFLVCGAASMIFALIVEDVSWQGIYAARISILYAGVLAVGVAFTGQVIGQRYAQAADAAIIMSAEMLFAALFGFLIMGDRLSMLGMYGCALILFCIIAVQLYPLMNTKGQCSPVS